MVTSVTRAQDSGRPKIVFVLTDDLSTDLLPYMPHVQALRQEGLTFENYFVSDSLCCPSRSSIPTGNLPHDTGVFSNVGPDGGFHVFHARGEERDTFAATLRRAGYRMALMGKYLNGYMGSTASENGSSTVRPSRAGREHRPRPHVRRARGHRAPRRRTPADSSAARRAGARLAQCDPRRGARPVRGTRAP